MKLLFYVLLITLSYIFDINYTHTIYGVGKNLAGQLGDGTLNETHIPVETFTSGVLKGKVIKQTACGDSFTMFLDTEGIAYGVGNNEYGELGDGTNTNSLIPVETLLLGKKIISISSGGSFTIYLDSNGKIYASGENDMGQLGDGTKINRNVPIEVLTSDILSGKIINQVSAGSSHAMYLDSEGKVYGVGGNWNGQLGDGTTVDRITPVQTKISKAIEGRFIIQIASGSIFTMLLDSNGKVYGMGGNGYGQLGDGTTSSRFEPVSIDDTEILFGKIIVQISCGYYHTMLLDSNGYVYGVGFNFYGQLGDGSNVNKLTPVAVSTSGVLYRKNIVQISTGYQYSMFLDSEGNVYGVGNNNVGQIGDGSTTDTTVPVLSQFSKISFLDSSESHTMSIRCPEDYACIIENQSLVVTKCPPGTFSPEGTPRCLLLPGLFTLPILLTIIFIVIFFVFCTLVFITIVLFIFIGYKLTYISRENRIKNEYEEVG